MAHTDTLALQETLNYRFKNEKLLTEALTHPSYAYESRDKDVTDYNRLEFFGDSILGMVVAEHLYDKYRGHPEGELTRMRALIVNKDNLSKKANEIGIAPYLFLGKGEEKIGGRRNATNLSDSLEAIIAAIYLDGGFEKAREFILRTII